MTRGRQDAGNNHTSMSGILSDTVQITQSLITQKNAQVVELVDDVNGPTNVAGAGSAGATYVQEAQVLWEAGRR